MVRTRLLAKLPFTEKKSPNEQNCVQMNTKDHNFIWDQKKVVDRESRLIPRKIKETIHFLKNPNYINKISYMLPEMWLPNSR